MPCAGYYGTNGTLQWVIGDLTVNDSSCTRCPAGKFQVQRGALKCDPCNDPDFTTGVPGAISPRQCTLEPSVRHGPNYPAKTAVSVTWELLSYFTPLQDERTIDVAATVSMRFLGPEHVAGHRLATGERCHFVGPISSHPHSATVCP